MKRLLATLTLCALLCAMLPLAALAEPTYIIPDSDTRRLTREELWQWDYESLGYILNEIFARHGYTFVSGEKYDVYFRGKSWYKPVYSTNNQAAYRELTTVEWDNEALVKQVRQEMQAAGTSNPSGKSLWDMNDQNSSYYQPTVYNPQLSFIPTYAEPNQRYPIYSAPSYSAWRGADGKALCSTNAPIRVAGWENNWLLIYYETTLGIARIGYVNIADMDYPPESYTQLNFAYASANLMYGGSNLTDDPVIACSPICYLPQGTWVTYLATYNSPNYSGNWDYIQTLVNGKVVRGFIPCGLLEISY